MPPSRLCHFHKFGDAVFGVKHDGALDYLAYEEGKGWLEWENLGGKFRRDRFLYAVYPLKLF